MGLLFFEKIYQAGFMEESIGAWVRKCNVPIHVESTMGLLSLEMRGYSKQGSGESN